MRTHNKADNRCRRLLMNLIRSAGTSPLAVEEVNDDKQRGDLLAEGLAILVQLHALRFRSESLG